MSTNYLGSNTFGIASSPAAVPEGALPPLPDQAEFEKQARYQGATNFTLVHPDFLVCNNGWTPATYRDPMTELAWRVWANKRAAVEADRASQEKLLREKTGIIKVHQVVLAERDAEIAALRADRAQQHQSGHMPPFAAPASLDKDAWAEMVGDVAALYARLLAEKRNAHAAQGRDRGMEYYIADAIGWAVAELQRRCRAQGGDGAPGGGGDAKTAETRMDTEFEGGGRAADRAQQGEPVAVEKINMAQAGVGERAHGYCAGWNDCVDEFSRAATKAAAPADEPKWHAPGMGEVHSHDHKYMIDCQRETADPDQDYVADDELAKRVCAALNGTRAAPVPERAKAQPGIPTAGEVSIDTPPFRELLDEFAYRASERRAMGGDFGSAEAEEKAEAALISYIDRCRAPASTTPTSGEVEKAGWISADERLPEVGELVMVYSPPTKYDHPGTVNIGFDCIDPNDDDHASWLGHNEHYEHFCCVAKPEGSTGPSEKAPYTHWMPLPVGPSEAKAGEPKACWSCKRAYTAEQWANADGNCPHCGVEIEEAGEDA